MLKIYCVILDLSNIWPGQINFVYFRERGHLRPLVIELQIALVIVSLHVLQVALGGSDWSGTQAGDATGSLIHGHRFTMQQSRVATLSSPLWFRP